MIAVVARLAMLLPWWARALIAAARHWRDVRDLVDWLGGGSTTRAANEAAALRVALDHYAETGDDAPLMALCHEWKLARCPKVE